MRFLLLGMALGAWLFVSGLILVLGFVMFGWVPPAPDQSNFVILYLPWLLLLPLGLMTIRLKKLRRD